MSFSGKVYVLGLCAGAGWIGAIVMLVIGLVIDQPGVAGGSAGVFSGAIAATSGLFAVIKGDKADK